MRGVIKPCFVVRHLETLINVSAICISTKKQATDFSAYILVIYSTKVLCIPKDATDPEPTKKDKDEKKEEKKEEKPRAPKALGWVKKAWYPVFAPAAFGERQIASAASDKPEFLVGRVLWVTLSELTGNMRDFKSKVKLKITKVEGGKARTEYDGQQMVGEQLARLIRRWASRIDNIEHVALSDKTKLVVKTLTISQRRVNTSIKKDLRALVGKNIREHASTKNLDDFVREINTGVLSKAVSSGVSKIYPVRLIEVRMVERE